MTKIVCSVCGSDDVQAQVWTKPNENFERTTEFVDDILDKPADCYCCRCDEHQKLIVVNKADSEPVKNRFTCPECQEKTLKYAIIDVDGTNLEEGYSCSECGANFIGLDNEQVIDSWKSSEPTGRYVLVAFPEDSKIYSDHEHGYDSHNSEDNGAMYVPEHFYIAYTGTESDSNKLFVPVTWPESQEYFELQHTSESIYELCEPIEHGKAFDDFGGQAIWVPLCLINKTKS